MLPFAVIDRWADNYDPTPVTTYFPNDALTGTAGWTPNDACQPTASPADADIRRTTATRTTPGGR